MANPVRDASACMVRRNMCDFTPESGSGAMSVRDAYKLAGQGRKQASLAASRLESLIYRSPDALSGLRFDAITYLSGTDLTAGNSAQAASQAIIRRLNEALDGHASRVTKALLDPSDIERLRIFRQEVRALINPNYERAAEPAGTGPTALPLTARRTCSDGKPRTD